MSQGLPGGSEQASSHKIYIIHIYTFIYKHKIYIPCPDWFRPLPLTKPYYVKPVAKLLSG